MTSTQATKTMPFLQSIVIDSEQWPSWAATVAVFIRLPLVHLVENTLANLQQMLQWMPLTMNLLQQSSFGRITGPSHHIRDLATTIVFASSVVVSHRRWKW